METFVKKPIKSFVLRQGRFSAAQKSSLERAWPRFGLSLNHCLLDFKTIFNRDAPTFIEVGFGMGHALSEMAEAHPENNYIGIEVHKPGVGALLKLVEQKGLDNIRVFNEDAVEVFQSCISKNSLGGVFIFFPDPWHKTKHKKRRLVQKDFVMMVAEFLKKDGFLHLATDWEDYAKQMMLVASNVTELNNSAGFGKFSERPIYRPVTKFEKRGQRLGHGVWDLIFKKK